MGKTVCSWCDTIIVEDNGFDSDSYGICKKCHEEIRKDMDNFRKRQEEAAKKKL